MSTYQSGTFTALYMMKFLSNDDMVGRLGDFSLDEYEKDTFTLKLGKFERVVAAKVGVSKDRLYATSMQFLIHEDLENL